MPTFTSGVKTLSLNSINIVTSERLVLKHLESYGFDQISPNVKEKQYFVHECQDNSNISVTIVPALPTNRVDDEVFRVKTVTFAISCSLADFNLTPATLGKNAVFSENGDLQYVMITPSWANGLVKFVVIADPFNIKSGKILLWNDVNANFNSFQSTSESKSKVKRVDHLAFGMPLLQQREAFNWFKTILGFERVRDLNEPEEGITVKQEAAGMLMLTLDNSKHKVRGVLPFSIVLVSPLQGHGGQVADFVDLHNTGVQHIALECFNMAELATAIRQENSPVTIAKPNASFYDSRLLEALSSKTHWEKLSKQVAIAKENGFIINIKLPGDDGVNPGILQQMFTLPPSPNCSTFFEIIQRENFLGFAPVSIATLFESIEANLSVLYLDEFLGAAWVKEWVKDLWENDGIKINLHSVSFSSKTQLCSYLKGTSSTFDVVVSSFFPIDSQVLSLFKKAPVLIHAQGSGYNHIDVDWCTKNGIVVCNNIDCIRCSNEVAEYVMAAILSSSSAIEIFDKQIKHGVWNRDSAARDSLSGTTLGIIGYGKKQIGQKLASFAEPFNIKIKIHDPLFKSVDLNELLQTSDFISINVPLNSSTRNLLDASALSKLKQNAVLINTSRGGVVNETALIKALNASQLRLYVTDVLESEPMVSHDPITVHPKVICTPHIAGKTSQSVVLAARKLTENFINVIKKQPLSRQINGNVTQRISSDIKSEISSSSNGGAKTMRDIFDIYCRPGSNVLNLAAGMVELVPPEKLRSIASNLVLLDSSVAYSDISSFHMYRDRKGDTVYRKAIQFLQENHYKLGNLPLSNILATSGVSGGTLCVYLHLREKFEPAGSGRKIRIGLFDPFYIYHREQAVSVFGASGVEFEYIPVKKSDLSFDIPAIWSAAKRCDAIVFTNPGNPTAHALTLEERNAFQEIAQKNPSCVFVADEVYADMTNVAHVSFSAPFAENVVVVRGFSKALAAGAWRLGYALGHENMLKRLAEAHDRVFICANWTQMAVGSYILNHFDDFQAHLSKVNTILNANEQILATAFLKGLGWTLIPGDGSMFRLIKHTCETDDQAFELLISKGVATVPGSMFAAPTNEGKSVGMVRIHLAFETDKAVAVARRLVQ
ncbi:hypothetical protein HK100_000398 [Physocladia obscura]|uniref:Aminotransferase class I/classII domain-containing protein n=1 Tax=Physocladia obscura TaxID=109957 RepID=A0AAD5T0Z3_9FUNG|nr:hypothetical protein HK100_000398 [Physocladia obscura]